MRKHMELGIFAPTMGSMPPIGKRNSNLLSTVEQTTEITYDYNRRLAETADQAGMELYLMPARHGGGYGNSRFWGTSIDSMTTTAAIAVTTQKIKLFSTVHTAMWHPALVARMASTLVQISNGRWGLNLVGGWSTKEFEMMGIPLPEHDDRYKLSAEFVEILKKFWTEDWFDYDGDYYTIRGGVCDPKPAVLPSLVNAGVSPAARDMCARYCDYYFTGGADPKRVGEECNDMRERAASYGRNIICVASTFILCRENQKDVNSRVAEIMAHVDYDAGRAIYDVLLPQTKGSADSATKSKTIFNRDELIRNTVMGMTAEPLLGTPDCIAEQLAELQDAGVDAYVFHGIDLQQELEGLVTMLLPELERLEVRQPRHR